MGDRRWKIEERREKKGDRVKKNPMHKFEDLLAWQKARELVKMIYRLTNEDTIKRDFGLCSQIQRAAVSIMTNIAEGFERVHIKEKLQFYNIARASCGEIRSLLYIVEDIHFDLYFRYPLLNETIETTGKLISGLIKSTETRK